MTVPTIEGSDEVEVPAGAQHGDVVVLKGEGLPPLQRPASAATCTSSSRSSSRATSATSSWSWSGSSTQSLDGRDEPAAARKQK